MSNTADQVVVTGTKPFNNIEPITLVIRKQDELRYPVLKADKPYRKFAKKARWQRD